LGSVPAGVDSTQWYGQRGSLQVTGQPQWYNDNFEVVLDIEMQIALAPSASEIEVYEGPNTDQGFVDVLNRMTQDNSAKSMSSSWMITEGDDSAIARSFTSDFQEMAAQGQSMYVASGDDKSGLGGGYITDPADQPYVTAVGGTSLNTDSMNNWTSETVWNNSQGRSSGGVSSTEAMPSYQSGVAGMDTTNTVGLSPQGGGGEPGRNIPDVALGADPNASPYAVYCTDDLYPGWTDGGGTSAAAPLWAAFNALANQQRSLNGGSIVGFANPFIYSTAQSSHYQYDFHDITVGGNGVSNDNAQTGYDRSTGWGSFNGFYLLQDWAPFPPSFMTWNINGPVPNNETTNSRPASLVYNGQLYLFIRGTSGSLLYTTFNGNSWSRYNSVPNNGSTPSG
jgi:kumamolisin